MNVLKRKDFARWQAGERLSDTALCKAAQEMESGLIDADLGGPPLQEANSPSRCGKEWRLPYIVSGPARVGHRYVFLHGFPKSDKANITRDEKKRCNMPGRYFLSYRPPSW